MNIATVILAILINWPFAKTEPPVKITEGWIYRGSIGDVKGDMHKAVDFVCQKENGEYIPFDIYSMHDGVAFQSEVESWGPFVLIRKQIDKTHWIDTLYGHLDNIPSSIPKLEKSEDGGAIFPEEAPADKKPVGFPIKAGTLIGTAGNKGWTHGIIHLHFELQIHVPETESLGLGKRDPFGIYDYESREIEPGTTKEFYPQPGSSLKGLPHYFTSDDPPFANAK